jgi:hypothetical protein
MAGSGLFLSFIVYAKDMRSGSVLLKNYKLGPIQTEKTPLLDN